VCDSVVALMGDGRLAALPGGVEEYLARRAAGEARLPDDRRSATGVTPAARPPAGASAADVRAARKEVTRLERRLERLAAEEADLHAQLAAAATDYERVAALDARLRELLARKEQAETDWLAAAEVAES
jgi:ATP-binding cassette subfamily F protein uup